MQHLVFLLQTIESLEMPPNWGACEFGGISCVYDFFNSYLLFYWNMADLQCHAGFCCTVK